MMYAFLFLFLIFSFLGYEILSKFFMISSIFVVIMRIFAFSSFMKLFHEDSIKLKNIIENDNYIILHGFFSLYKENTNFTMFFIEIFFISLFFILTQDYNTTLIYFIIKIIYDISFIDFKKIFEDFVNKNYDNDQIRKILNS